MQYLFVFLIFLVLRNKKIIMLKNLCRKVAHPLILARVGSPTKLEPWAEKKLIMRHHY